MYLSTKYYAPSLGWTCVFRQHKAESHCRHLHGYAVGVKLVFATDELDVRGWAVDFGSLKSFKGILEDLFDHTTIIAEDDPNLKDFKYLDMCDLIKLRVLPRSSCECLAEYLYEVLDIWLKDNGYKPRIWIHSVEVQEHDANSAIFIPDEIYKDPRDL